MYSELFHLGPLTIRAYGLCMALGFILSWQAALRLCRLAGRNPDQLTSLLSWMMLLSVAGARTAYVMEHWSAEFASNPGAIIRLDQGGLMFYGGFIAALLVLMINALIRRESLFANTDLLAGVLPLGHALGRVGCFMHGCCYGRITECAIGIRFPHHSPAWWEQVSSMPPLIAQSAAWSLPVIPTQLIEAGVNLLLFALLYTLYVKQHQQRGLVTGSYMVCYGILRFAIEFLRGDPRMAVGPLSISQTISIGVFCIGVVTLLRARSQPCPLP